MKRTLSGVPMHRERQAQLRILDRLEARHGRKFRAEIRRASAAMIAAYRATGSMPALPEDHEGKMRTIYLALAIDAVSAFGGRIIDQAKHAGLGLERKSFVDLFQRIALDFIQSEMIRRRIAMVSQTTRQQIVDQIIKGQENGLSVDEIARLITDRLPSFTKFRGALIARTETHAAANTGAFEVAKRTGSEYKKEWISVEDERTRDFGEGDREQDEFNHREMDGQIRQREQPFDMRHKSGDIFKIQFPGAPALANGAPSPGGAVINCRCAVGYFLDI